MEYPRQANVSGSWVKAGDVQSGIRCKLVSETVRTESQFKNEDGTSKMQDVAKIRFENKDEPMNIAINRATLNGLIEAFGTESKDWMGHYLTTHTEKMIVGGRAVRALYLVPEGYEVTEDDGGYMVVGPIAKTETGDGVDAPAPAEKSIEYPADEIRPEDIPF